MLEDDEGQPPWVVAARGLDAEHTMIEVAERSVLLARALGLGLAHVTLSARARRGPPIVIAAGDELEAWPALHRIDVPIAARDVEGVLSLARAVTLAPVDRAHLALLSQLIGLAAGRAALAAALDESELERRELVVKVSHDIRTPLQSFSLGMDALRLGQAPNDERTAQTLARMARSVQLLGRIVDDADDASLVYDGKLALRIASYGPDALVARACEQLANTALSRGSTIVRETSALSPVGCDGARITRALAMLVDNALRYGTRGTIVTVRARAHDEYVRFEVHDDGPGIGAAVRERILARPYRDRVGGRVGLGLYLASAIAVAHGGSLDLSAEASASFTVGLEIPRGVGARVA